MKKTKTILYLASAALLLASCGGNVPANSSSSDQAPSSSEETKAWSEEDSSTILSFVGESLPYPAGFASYPSVEIVNDSATSTSFLEIVYPCKALSIADYYQDLKAKGWNVIVGYDGSAEQKDSSGVIFYELTKIGSNGKGLNLTYFHLKRLDGTNRDVIQVYNDFSASQNKATEWKESEKATFASVLGEVPPLMKLGDPYAVSINQGVHCADMLAEDLTSENLDILKSAGYALDEELSSANACYVLKKELQDGNALLASLYYYSGNHASFFFQADVKEYSSWPKEFLSSFESKSGYTIPEFEIEDIDTYYCYTKAGVHYVYGYTEKFGVEYVYESKLSNSGLIYDGAQQWYASWDEKYYVQIITEYISTGEKVFAIAFSTIDAPYTLIADGYPSETVASFLEENGISANAPSFDYSSYSPYSTCHVRKQDYKDVYPDYLSAVKADPTSYGLDEKSSESEIEAKAKELAKEATVLQISIYDPKHETTIEDAYNGITGYQVNDYLIETLRQAKWSRLERTLESAYDVTYEDPTGTIAIGIDLVEEVSIISITYGSGQAHSPVFAFEETTIALSRGNQTRLLYTADMLPYEVTFSSSDPDMVSVDKRGFVKVSENAEIGSTVTITASMNVPDEGKKEIQCLINIAPSYDGESAISDVAKRFNSHFGLKTGDEGAANPKTVSISDPDEGSVFTYWSLELSNPALTSIDEAKTLMAEVLLPIGFANENDNVWGSGLLSDDTPCQMIEYYWYGENCSVQLSVNVYEKEGSVIIAIDSFFSE